MSGLSAAHGPRNKARELDRRVSQLGLRLAAGRWSSYLRVFGRQELLLPLAVFAAFLNATIAFAQAGPGSWMATGIYTGNGQATHAITGVGFTPDVVIIKGGLDEATMVRTSTMPSGHSKPLGRDEPLIPGTIQSLDADGFTLNTDRRVNLPITLYYWVAFR